MSPTCHHAVTIPAQADRLGAGGESLRDRSDQSCKVATSQADGSHDQIRDVASLGRGFVAVVKIMGDVLVPSLSMGAVVFPLPDKLMETAS